MYLALDLYAITARYVGSPEDLNNVLAAFESSTPATTETHLQDPDTSGEMRDDPMVGFALFINGLVHELSSGRLARPIGGFILFLFLTILIRIDDGQVLLPRTRFVTYDDAGMAVIHLQADTRLSELSLIGYSTALERDQKQTLRAEVVGIRRLLD